MTQELKDLVLDACNRHSSGGFKHLIMRHEMEGRFTDEMNENCEPFKLGTLSYPAGDTFKEVDPIAFDQEFGIWLDQGMGETYIDVVPEEYYVEACYLTDFVEYLAEKGEKELLGQLKRHPYSNGDLREAIDHALTETFSEGT